MHITNQQEFKNVVSGLRAELKNAGVTQFSHTQMQEILAKALGASSWGELKTKLPKEMQRKPTSAAALKVVRCAADLDPLNLQPLSNDDGWLDLVEPGEDGELITGFFETLEGTLEDIKACTCAATGERRGADGKVEIEFGGETDVNWDGQETQVGDNQRVLWWTEGSETVNEVHCVMAPENFDADEPEEALVRVALVDIYERIVRENPKCDLQTALGECEGPRDYRPTLAWIAQELKFDLHEGEAQALLLRLRGQKNLF